MPRAGLTPTIVVAEGSDVADEAGFDQLTLAAVAQRLGVALPSLYKHVRGLDDLRRQMAALALVELGDSVSRATVGRSRGDALRGLAGAYWDYAHRHPGRYAATLRAPAAQSAADTAVDAGGSDHAFAPGSGGVEVDVVAAATDLLAVVFAILEGYGITGDDAVDATRMLRAVLHGYVALEAAGGFGLPRDVRRSFDRAIDAIDVSLTNWA